MSVAFVLCGALAREVIAIAHRQSWDVALHGVSAVEHMRPQRIAPLVEQKLRELIPHHERVVVVYGDCGTAGDLDVVLQRYHVPRISGPHCYEMYAGAANHEALLADQLGTFFLTDFLLRGFDGLMWKGLGLDRFPELRETYFAHYTRLVYLSQDPTPALLEKARQVSERLGLPLEIRHTGYGELETRLVELMSHIAEPQFQPQLPVDEHGNLPNSVLARHPGPSSRERRPRPQRGAGQRAASSTLSGGD